MLKGINLSLSSLCSADCIFCPTRRGTRISQKIMPFAVAKKVIDEAASQDFRRVHTIEHLSFGENGDAFINPEIISIMRYAKEALPHAKTLLFTNFWNFTEEKARVILREGLIDHVHCDVDGCTPDGYVRVKRLDLNVVSENMRTFLRVRKETGGKSSLNILVLTYAQYLSALKRKYGLTPVKIKEGDVVPLKDEFAGIKAAWWPLLDRKRDLINRLPVYGWAERDRVTPPTAAECSQYSCLYFSRVEHEAFIAPDGTWYACCLDSDNELALGNVMQQSLQEIYDGEPRRTLIARLKNKDFTAIKGPCRTVNCCVAIHEYPLEVMCERLFGRSTIARFKHTRLYRRMRNLLTPELLDFFTRGKQR